MDGVLWRRVFRLLRGFGLLTAAYLWFFRSIDLINALVTRHAALEVPTYILLSMFPLFCLKTHGRAADTNGR